jgi:CheY-like chemotaxis protein
MSSLVILMMQTLVVLNLQNQEDNRFKSIPFIILTANIDDSIKFKQLEHGVNDL